MMRAYGADAERMAAILKAMGHPTRLAILDRIARGEWCVSRLEEVLHQSQANISQHLAVMRDRGLVIAERKGNKTCYRLADERITELLAMARAVFAARAAGGRAA
jgi:DNA-binding transcriptional ArsR family regulator